MQRRYNNYRGNSMQGPSYRGKGGGGGEGGGVPTWTRFFVVKFYAITPELVLITVIRTLVNV